LEKNDEQNLKIFRESEKNNIIDGTRSDGKKKEKYDNQQTTVPNVYAVGDIATDRHYVVLAAASGALASISIYETLLRDAIKRRRSGTSKSTINTT